MRNSIFFLVLLSGLIYSCGGAGGSALSGSTSTSTSGYPYTHHVENKGTTPVEGDEVTYHETIYWNDSLVYTTHKLGAPKKVVIPKRSSIADPPPPNYEMLMIMSEGDSVSVTQSLDTIPNLPPQYKPTDKFYYKMKLVAIKSKAEVDAEAGKLKARESDVASSTGAVIDNYNAGKLNVETTPTGLKYIMHEVGSGRQATAGKTVSVHYSGFLLDKGNFDNSFKRGRTFDFPLGAGQVIPGWDEGIAILKEGGKATFFIPGDLAYGPGGNPRSNPPIAPNAELVFYVELLEVK